MSSTLASPVGVVAVAVFAILFSLAVYFPALFSVHRKVVPDPTHDDPLAPYGMVPWKDWTEFVEKVCIPLVECEAGDDDDLEQQLMIEFRKASPHYVACALFFAYNRAKAADPSLKPQ